MDLQAKVHTTCTIECTTASANIAPNETARDNVYDLLPNGLCHILFQRGARIDAGLIVISYQCRR